MSNIYDDDHFFKQYGNMSRSKDGLQAAGEWHDFQKMLPDFTEKKVLDLGCGYGWHCRYAEEHGATAILGVDGSYKMIEKAQEMTTSDKINYQVLDLQEIQTIDQTFDVVMSSLVFHYIEDFTSLVQKISKLLNKDGAFVFSVEHPVFTAEGTQQWVYQDDAISHWPVDRYFMEGKRTSTFLDTEVTKYHKTLTTYLNTLLNNGFHITQIVEPQPAEHLLDVPGMKDELRRPMMLLISAKKEA